MAPHSSTLAWKIPWVEEPGGLQSMGSQRVRHDWVTSLSLFTFMHWRRKWQLTPVFLPGESRGRRSLVGCPLWVTQSRTRLKWLSSSSSSNTNMDIITLSKDGVLLWWRYEAFFYVVMRPHFSELFKQHLRADENSGVILTKIISQPVSKFLIACLIYGRYMINL